MLESNQTPLEADINASPVGIYLQKMTTSDMSTWTFTCKVHTVEGVQGLVFSQPGQATHIHVNTPELIPIVDRL